MKPESTITLPSSFDGAPQTVAFHEAVGKRRPVLVALHSWSGTREEDGVRRAWFEGCRARDWHCVFPEFRGANDRPEACGSDAAVADVLDAAQWSLERFDVDHRRIFLAGLGGGGHMALLAASRFPSIWTAVSAWSPVTDLARWHGEAVERGLAYVAELERVCGGAPGASHDVDEEYRRRSPQSELWRAHILPVDIAVGVRDGRDGGPVPVGHAVRAFNALVQAGERYDAMIDGVVIGTLERRGTLPRGFDAGPVDDPGWDRAIILRRAAGLARLTVFEGGHETLYDAAFGWFERF